MTAPSPDAAPVSLEDIEGAALRIAPYIRRTPLERSASLSARFGGDVYLKLECLQRTGSFKIRGALSAMGVIPRGIRERGVVTASAGNHGLGVAYAGRIFQVPVTVHVPAAAVAVKCTRIAALGAELVRVEGNYDIAAAAARRFAEDRGLPYLHAFSDPAVVAGQGTTALEIMADVPAIRSIVAPVGGGGLIGGVGTAVAGRVQVIGVQSEATASMAASLKEGRPVSLMDRPTLCDGLAGDVDERSLALAQRVVDRLLLVSEAEIRAAMKQLYIDEGLIVEASGAVGVAALSGGALQGISGPIAIVVSGSNIDLRKLADVLDREGVG